MPGPRQAHQIGGQLSVRSLDVEGERRVNAKSIMGVMMLAAGNGVTVDIDNQW